MSDQTLHPESPQRNQEDYTGSLCWLLPDGQHTIIDIETIPLVQRYSWRLKGGRVSCHTSRKGKKVEIYLHRELSVPPLGLETDHRNRIPHDNRYSNLRHCTRSQNSMNRGPWKKKASRFKGVKWRARSEAWEVYAGGSANRIFLGYFKDEVQAAKAYNAYALEKYGEWACLNPV